jgi:2-polyprenyl-6-methoxyphenol hydroxylase-like FAD-dependent oxidoreductase
MPPTGGQGASQAFEDALTLADVLNVLNSKESTPKEIVSRWQVVRQERVKKILAFTKSGGDMRKSSVSTFQQIVKEWMMWAYMLWIGPSAGLGWIYEYDTAKPGIV